MLARVYKIKLIPIKEWPMIKYPGKSITNIDVFLKQEEKCLDVVGMLRFIIKTHVVAEFIKHVQSIRDSIHDLPGIEHSNSVHD